MRGRYHSAQPTVFGMVRPRLLPWRLHRRCLAARDAWQESARLACMPIIHTATDENCPTYRVVSHGYGSAATGGVPVPAGQVRTGETPMVPPFLKSKE